MSPASGRPDPVRIRAAHRRVLDALAARREPEGYWIGRLSSSALATATAVAALAAADDAQDAPAVRSGLDWLARTRRADGWGDTPESPANLAATALAEAAFALAGEPRASLLPADLPAALAARYGGDRTFAVPILSACALAGRADWRDIPPLPLELALLPRPLLRLGPLQVVSYALPALIAVGALLHRKAPAAGLAGRLRGLALRPALARLPALQPESGGFLEAVPLTAFVCLALIGAGEAAHPTVARGLAFLRSLRREDGSWPIDRDLSVYLTAQAARTPAGRNRMTLDWLRARQRRAPHPFTGAAPGGWAWTDHDGGVPDADDTACALLALAADGGPEVETGMRWLLDLQNRDGGWPTFCRGWHKLPFDRSATDLTAQALRALAAAGCSAPRRRRAAARGFAHLAATQRPGGAWTPLWFGSQRTGDQTNPVLGTARVLLAYEAHGRLDAPQARAGIGYLLAAQAADGAWGAEPDATPTIEETAAAVEALAAPAAPAEAQAAALRGAHRLADLLETGAAPAPIGLYFASLWYAEELYPLLWAALALGRAADLASASPAPTRS